MVASAGFNPFLYWFAGILGIIGLILGFIGRSRAKRGEATNGTMALWGIITSAVVVILSIVEIVVIIMGSEWNIELSVGPVVVVGDAASPAAENTTASPAVETSAPGQADAEEVIVYDLEAGDCLADSLPGGGEEVFALETVPCSEPHSEEIYATLTLPEGDFPGMNATAEQAEELCITEFENFVGVPYEGSALYVDLVTPSERTWSEGDRLVICAIYDPAGDTTGTLADANR